MLILLLILLGFGLVAVGFHFFDKQADSPIVEGPVSCATCTGEDERCMADCMMEAAINPIEYFDDEELDRFAGKAPDSYTPEEEAEFEEIATTIRPQEVMAWTRSLTLRGIEIPTGVKELIVDLASEAMETAPPTDRKAS